MKCSKCNRKNKKIAIYCKRCGTKFSEKEIKKARKNSIVGILDFLEKIYNICSLNIITDTLAFKILSIVVVFSIGIYSVILNGNHFKVKEGDNYSVQYNQTKEEYYIISESNQADIRLYIPSSVKDITVKEYNEESLISEASFSKEDTICLDKNNNNYYLLEANYDKKKENIKLYVLESSDLVGEENE